MQESIRSDCRVDGRSLYETRPVRIEILPDDSGASVSLGNTSMHGTIKSELEKPRGSADGRLAIDVKFSPMASTAFTNVRLCHGDMVNAYHCSVASFTFVLLCCTATPIT